VGPDPAVLDAALEELQAIYNEDQVNEKVVQGKIMEVQGRSLVTTGQGSTSTHVKMSQKLGKLLMAPKSRAAPTRSLSEPPIATAAAEDPVSPESMGEAEFVEEWMDEEMVLRAAVPKTKAKARQFPSHWH